MLQTITNNPVPFCIPLASRPVESLPAESQAEVLSFLARRAEHTFVMSGWIRDNGLVSTLNRGSFYGHRDAQGQLDGVALIGHVTLFETDNGAALDAFARLTRNSPSAHVIMAERQSVERFLGYYRVNGQAPSLICREQLFEQRNQEAIDVAVPNLRLAAPDDLELIVPVHAQMAFEASGVNPLDEDSVGFYQRCHRRIQQRRVWVVVENNRLVFKADIISDLPEVVYLEGVYVNQEDRGRGLGPRCMKQLTSELLTRTESVCLLVDQENDAASACYQKAGYRLRDLYDTLYLGRSHDLIVQ